MMTVDGGFSERVKFGNLPDRNSELVGEWRNNVDRLSINTNVKEFTKKNERVSFTHH